MKMLPFRSVFFLLLSPLTLASPTLETRSGCLTDAQATKLVDVMVSISVKFKIADVQAYIADDFLAQSDSINFFSNGALKPGQITGNKTEFLEGSYNLTSTTTQPTIKVLNMFHNCDDIAFRWVNDEKPLGLRGIDYMTVKKGTMMIERDFSEFNSAALLVDAGLFPCK